jgi:hypothetical protein
MVRGLARAGGGSAEFIYPGERIEPKVLRQLARATSVPNEITALSTKYGLLSRETSFVAAAWSGQGKPQVVIRPGKPTVDLKTGVVRKLVDQNPSDFHFLTWNASETRSAASASTRRCGGSRRE